MRKHPSRFASALGLKRMLHILISPTASARRCETALHLVGQAARRGNGTPTAHRFLVNFLWDLRRERHLSDEVQHQVRGASAWHARNSGPVNARLGSGDAE